MSGNSIPEYQGPVFVPKSQPVSKMIRGAGAQFDKFTRLSSSESGYSEDLNMSPRKLLEQGDIKFKAMEDTLSQDMSKLQLKSPWNPLPSQLYSYQWEMPSLWRGSIVDTTKQVTMDETPLPPLTSIKLPLKTFPTKQHSNSSTDKFYEDWLKLKIQQKAVETPPILPPQISFSDLPKRLHISNIPFRFREPHIFYIFSQFGEVTDAEIIYNDKGSKGFGFVTLAKAKDADKAQMSLHGSTVEGRVIEVNLATPKMVPSSRSRPIPCPVPTSWEFQQASHPSLLPTNSFSPSYSTTTFPPSYTTTTLLEAQTRLAEAQLAVLQMQQKMLHSQYRVEKAEDHVDWSRKGEGSW